MYNPINDRINNLMNQKQMIESQLQTIQQKEYDGEWFA